MTADPTPTQAAEARRAEIARLHEIASKKRLAAHMTDPDEATYRQCWIDYDTAEAAFATELSRLTAALAAREGYVLVPVEPTGEMKVSGADWTNYLRAKHVPEETRDQFVASQVYQAMVAVRPK